MNTTELIEALSRPAAYPGAVGRVEVRQTHISVLFFTADRVYKVKKPVDFGFLDFSTLERRRFFCGEEVRLNRRLAPDVYLGVNAVIRDPDGSVRIAAGGQSPDPGRIVDYAVEMRRLPDERMLDRLLDEGAIDNAVIDQLVRVLLDFHRGADTGPEVSAHGEPDAVAASVLRNLDEITELVGPGGVLSKRLRRRLERAAREFLETSRDLLGKRVRAGRIRDGHGDLHAGNICLTPDGIVIYDCIEFSAAIRCGDTARDIAFLVMDLDARGFRGFGGYLASRYAAGADDGDMPALLPFYKTHWAAVRGKVAALRSADSAIEAIGRREARLEAMRYFHLAASYRLPPALLLMCGLPGSGKSWAARHLAHCLGAAHLRSDVIRKRLAGVSPTAHPTGPVAEALYGPDSSRRTYETMLAEAASSLESGRGVVADATFARADARSGFMKLARARGVPVVVVHLAPPESVIAERLGARGGDAGEVSDADWTVYRRLRKNFQPPTELPPSLVVETDGTGDPESIAADVIDRLIEQSDQNGVDSPFER